MGQHQDTEIVYAAPEEQVHTCKGQIAEYGVVDSDDQKPQLFVTAPQLQKARLPAMLLKAEFSPQNSPAPVQ